VLGAGMVDPALFGYVEGYDAEELTGYAWGMGVERIAALRHAIPDIRMLWENDLRFMEQFG
jgi:phenylalanyl-tRNA synthetase alpha chain